MEPDAFPIYIYLETNFLNSKQVVKGVIKLYEGSYCNCRLITNEPNSETI